MNRTQLQNKAWILPNAKIGGRPCRVSIGRAAVLADIGNLVMEGGHDIKKEPGKVIEAAFIMSASDEDLEAYLTMGEDERKTMMRSFGIKHDDEIMEALSYMNTMNESAEASAFEAIEAPGKQPPEARTHPDNSPPSIGSPSATD